VAWMLRLVKIGAEGEGACTDIMEIRRPDAHASPHFASVTYRERGLCERFEVYEKTHTRSSDDRSVMSG